MICCLGFWYSLLATRQAINSFPIAIVAKLSHVNCNVSATLAETGICPPTCNPAKEDCSQGNLLTSGDRQVEQA